MSKSINIQMYSIRNVLLQDFFKGLTDIANIGYTGVEFAQYHGIDAKTMKKELDLRNLKAVGSHVGIDFLKSRLDEEIAYLKEIDCNQIVCPYSSMASIEDAKKFAELFNKIGEECYKNDIVFSYHNHSAELTMENGVYALDCFYENTDPKYVKAEIDVYWVAKVGVDPYKYVEKYKDRMELVHLKQIKNNKNVDANIGEIDFKKVMDIVPNAIPVYEQEELTAEDGIKRIKIAYEHLNCIL